MNRFSHSTKWLMLPVLLLCVGSLMGATCISGTQLQDFGVSESARVIGGMVGMVLQLVLRAILPQTVIQ